MLKLAEVGVYTPWAAQESSLDWMPVTQPPDTNISVFGLTDQALQAAGQLTFGSPLPFVAVLAPISAGGVRAPQEVAAAFDGTPYMLYQTQAVYDQNDGGEPPRIMLLHWAKLRDQGDSDGGNGALASAAQRLGGALVFAMQVNYDYSQRRQAPAMSFAQALAMQVSPLGPPGPSEPGVPPPPGTPAPAPLPGAPAPAPPTAAPTTSKITLPIVGAALVASVLGFVVVRAARKKGR